jgi:hypothetical protein
MYYIEKWENGHLYVQITPNGRWKLKTLNLADIYEGINKKHINLAVGLDLAYELGQESSVQEKFKQS